MRLLRVQVPEFRALKDVDISFQPDFTPQVFPLGSLNGGGKSTLLQLIFVLLHCFWEKTFKGEYVKNLLSELEIQKSLSDSDAIKKLATITILNDEGIKITLDYFYDESEKIMNFRKTIDISKNICFPVTFNIGITLLKVISIDNANKNDNIDIYYLYDAVQKIQNGIFLVSPSNQPYLFLSREERRNLFNSTNNELYYESIKKLPKTLSNFFTFDFTDILTEVFNEAHAEDSRERIRTGRYGTNVEQLENSINSLFVDGKKIVPFIPKQERHRDITVQGVTFKLPSGEEIYPEDLSHGELKRLTIFVLIKYHKMNDSIVLMDEIENGFHPDWQYTIVRDLVEWGKNNQYILATHSYELCTAVTPAHVKELEPRLTK